MPTFPPAPPAVVRAPTAARPPAAPATRSRPHRPSVSPFHHARRSRGSCPRRRATTPRAVRLRHGRRGTGQGQEPCRSCTQPDARRQRRAHRRRRAHGQQHQADQPEIAAAQRPRGRERRYLPGPRECFANPNQQCEQSAARSPRRVAGPPARHGPRLSGQQQQQRCAREQTPEPRRAATTRSSWRRAPRPPPGRACRDTGGRSARRSARLRSAAAAAAQIAATAMAPMTTSDGHVHPPSHTCSATMASSGQPGSTSHAPLVAGPACRAATPTAARPVRPSPGPLRPPANGPALRAMRTMRGVGARPSCAVLPGPPLSCSRLLAPRHRSSSGAVLVTAALIVLRIFRLSPLRAGRLRRRSGHRRADGDAPGRGAGVAAVLLRPAVHDGRAAWMAAAVFL